MLGIIYNGTRYPDYYCYGHGYYSLVEGNGGLDINEETGKVMIYFNNLDPYVAS